MKKLFKLTLVAVALIMCSNTVSAQKFGYINFQELVMAMPEMDSVRIKMQAYQQELFDMMDAINVEYKTKTADYSKNMSTLSDSARQLKERELTDLQNRSQEFSQTAQQDLNDMQTKLMTPVVSRAEEAVAKISKQSSLLIVFDVVSGAMVYFDKAAMVDVMPLVKKELGIKDVPAPAATPAK